MQFYFLYEKAYQIKFQTCMQIHPLSIKFDELFNDDEILEIRMR